MTVGEVGDAATRFTVNAGLRVVGTTSLNSLRVHYTTQLGQSWKGEACCMEPGLVWGACSAPQQQAARLRPCPGGGCHPHGRPLPHLLSRAPAPPRCAAGENFPLENTHLPDVPLAVWGEQGILVLDTAAPGNAATQARARRHLPAASGLRPAHDTTLSPIHCCARGSHGSDSPPSPRPVPSGPFRRCRSRRARCGSTATRLRRPTRTFPLRIPSGPS